MELPTYTRTWHNDVYPAIDASRPELSAKGKRVVITGGAGGIGAATAEAFVVAGASEVFILGRTDKTLQATKKAIEGRHPGQKVVALVADVADPSGIDAAFAAISRSGPIDVYINNAAYFHFGAVGTADVANFWQHFEVNVKGALLTVQAAIQNMAADGIIINVSSAACHVPYVPVYDAYATSKLAAAKMFEYLHHEHPNLKVYNLQPGIIGSTGLASKATEQSGFSFPQQDTVELPGNFMVWLSSPEAVFLRGRYVWANWDVDELKAKAKALEEDPTLLTLGLLGWPQ